MRRNTGSSAYWVVDFLACLLCCVAARPASKDLANDAALSAAVCSIVYQLDQSPSSRGYHYSFFGNAFFINEQGYLLTAAHVLETFKDGGQPYILISRPNRPPRLLPAAVIAVDSEHDVAVLLATPNPFAGNHKVTFLMIQPSAANRLSPFRFILQSYRMLIPSKPLKKTALPAKFFPTNPPNSKNPLPRPKFSSSAMP